MAHYELIEKVARAVHEHLCRRDIMQYLDNPEDCEGIATAAIAAVRDTLVPVGWRYERNVQSPHMNCEARISGYQWPEWMQDSWTETPLYALPEEIKHGA